MLFAISIALMLTPVHGAFRDILTVCQQTPQMQLFGELLKLNPDLYAIYQPIRNGTIYVPSDTAMNNYFAQTGRIFRRDALSEAHAKNHADSSGGGLYAPPKAKRQLSSSVTKRAVRNTLDAGSSGGRFNSIVKVDPATIPTTKRQLPAPNTTLSTGVTLSTGAGAQSNILFGDIQCTQGLAHVVDSLFTLPEPVTDTLTATNRTKFLASINAANLAGTYNDADQITIFAPIDAAFANQSTIDATAIEYHVVADDTAFYTPLLTDGQVLKSAQGGNLYIRVVDDETFYVNCVLVVQTDAITTNGVIHAVQKILTPLSAPPECPGLPPVTTTSNSTSPELSTGFGSVGKAVNMMAVVGSLLAVVGIIV